MLKATFVRRRGSRDRVYVTRADGTSTAWDFPSYGDGLPHDLCHLVVEEDLGLDDGFWGLVDQGVDVSLVNNEATLTSDGTPLVERADTNLTGLRKAEAVVALLAGPVSAGVLPGPDSPASSFAGGHTTERARTDLPAMVTADVMAVIDQRLRTLTDQWRDLDDGGAITLSFSRAAT